MKKYVFNMISPTGEFCAVRRYTPTDEELLWKVEHPNAYHVLDVDKDCVWDPNRVIVFARSLSEAREKGKELALTAFMQFVKDRMALHAPSKAERLYTMPGPLYGSNIPARFHVNLMRVHWGNENCPGFRAWGSGRHVLRIFRNDIKQGEEFIFSFDDIRGSCGKEDIFGKFTSFGCEFDENLDRVIRRLFRNEFE